LILPTLPYSTNCHPLSDLFDKLSFIGRRIRGDPRPFGGIQLILSGKVAEDT
jgi:hypothetical protein